MRAVLFLAAALIATPASGQTVVPQSVSASEWFVEETTSQFDDKPVVDAWVTAKDSTFDRFGRVVWPRLNLICREGSTHLYIDVKGFFFSDHAGWGDVDVRVGKNKARTVGMTVSTDRGAIGLWHGKGVRLAKEMVGNDLIVTRVAPFNERAETFTFSLKGYDEAAGKVRKACRW